MAFKCTLMLLSALAAAAAAQQTLPRSLGELAHQRAKRQMTTICVEIEPNGPDESPYIMCKDADLLKNFQQPSQPAVQRPNYGSDKFQPASYNDKPYAAAKPAKPAAPQPDNGYGNAQQYYNNNNNNNKPSAAYYNAAESHKPAAAQTPEHMQHPYGHDEGYAPATPATQPAQATHPASNYQSYAPFQSGKAYFQNQPANYGKQNAPTYAAGNDGSPPTPSESAPHYGNAPTAAPLQTSYDAPAPTPYAPSNGGYGSSAYATPAPAAGGAAEQQQQSANPYGHSSTAYASDAAAPALATTPKSYGFPTVPYANPAGSAAAATPVAKGPGPASAAGAYAAAAAQDAPSPAAYLNHNGNAAGMQQPPSAYESLVAAAPAFRQPLSSRQRAPMDADVLDFPNINFNPAELQTFHQQRGMVRIPNKEVGNVEIAKPARVPAPRIAAPQRALPQLQRPTTMLQRAPANTQQPRAYSDDPIMNTFYNSLDESASVEIEDPIVSQVYPGYAAPQSYAMPNFYPQPQYPVAYQQPSYRAPYGDAIYPSYPPAAVMSSCARPPQPYVPQRMPQQCIEASNMGPTYAPYAPPTPYARDMGLQPIFIALPCYGQQAQTLGSAQQMHNESPMIGSPFGFGLFNPFGFRPWPFGGLLGAAAPDNALQPSLAFSNPFNFLGQPKQATTEEQSVGQKDAPEEGKETSPSTDLPQTEAVVGSSKSLDIHDEDADVDTSEEETSTDPITGAATTEIADKAADEVGDAQELGAALETESGEEELADNVSANTHLTNAEKAIDGGNEQKASDLRKRHNAKSFTNQQKRKYLQKI